MSSRDGSAPATSWVRAQATRPTPATPARHDGRVLTISREAGTGAHEIAERCIALLDAGDGAPWICIDRDIVERVLADHGLPTRLAAALSEDRARVVADTVAELFGDPDAHSLAAKTARTMLKVAAKGNVIIIGRASNVVLGRRANTFHVRLIGSLERRIARIGERSHLTHDAASMLVRKTDAARRRYVRSNYGVDVAAPLGYDLILNVDRMSPKAAARTIVAGLEARTISTWPIPTRPSATAVASGPAQPSGTATSATR